MSLSLPGTPDTIGDALRTLPGRLFAVIDGAAFEDLPGRLAAVGLEPVPLYADEVDLPELRYGPHLVACDTGFALEQVRDVQAGTATVVWWAWPPTGLETVRITAHLRRLALIDVPADRQDGMIGPPRHGTTLLAGTEEPVLFRHADPDVVAALLPVLNPAQRAQFFGGATAILTETAEGHLVQERAPAALPDDARFGRLTLSEAQYAALGTVYRAALRRRALHEFAPELPGLDRPTRQARLMAGFDRAEGYGLASKAQIWDFLTLEARYGPDFEHGAGRSDVAVELARTDLPPEERLWRAEIALQAARGEDWAPISGTRHRLAPRSP